MPETSQSDLFCCWDLDSGEHMTWGVNGGWMLAENAGPAGTSTNKGAYQVKVARPSMLEWSKTFGWSLWFEVRAVHVPTAFRFLQRWQGASSGNKHKMPSHKGVISFSLHMSGRKNQRFTWEGGVAPFLRQNISTSQ